LHGEELLHPLHNFPSCFQLFFVPKNAFEESFKQ